MKAHEVRGLPVEEIRSMIADAENELFQLRFQHGAGQLDNKLQLRDKRKEIAVLRTLLREETLKAELAEAGKILDALGTQYGITKINGLVRGERVHADRARLRRAVSLLMKHPRKREFETQYRTLRKLVVR